MNTRGAALLTALCLTGQALCAPTLERANGAWTLTRISGVRETLTPGKVKPTLTLSGLGDGSRSVQISGTTGCNSFAGQGTQNGTDVRFGPLRMTLRACLGAGGELERRYTQGISGVRSMVLSKASLVLVSRTTRLTFVRK